MVCNGATKRPSEKGLFSSTFSDKCRDKNPKCSLWSVMGKCKKSQWMNKYCCGTCKRIMDIPFSGGRVIMYRASVNSSYLPFVNIDSGENKTICQYFQRHVLSLSFNATKFC